MLTLDRYAAMLLRVKAFAAVFKQLRRDIASDERLGAGGGGGERGGGGGGKKQPASGDNKTGIFWSIASPR